MKTQVPKLDLYWPPKWLNYEAIPLCIGQPKKQIVWESGNCGVPNPVQSWATPEPQQLLSEAGPIITSPLVADDVSTCRCRQHISFGKQFLKHFYFLPEFLIYRIFFWKMIFLKPNVKNKTKPPPPIFCHTPKASASASCLWNSLLQQIN